MPYIRRRHRYEHVEVAERALGKPLPKGAIVHHVNGVKTDNCPENLVVCQDQAYHKLLHQRMRARDACGNPNWRCCKWCKKWDDPANGMAVTSKDAIHRACHAERERIARAEGRRRPPRAA